MRTIYIGGGQKSKKKGGLKWKLYLFLFLFLGIACSVLKVAAPTLVEEWINRQGAASQGYAFSIRNVDLSLGKGELILNDVKVYNQKTEDKLLESPKLTIQLDIRDFLTSEDKKVSLSADKVDLVLPEDFAGQEVDLNLSLVEGKFAELNVIERKEDVSRTVLKLNDVNLKVKDKSSFTMASVLSEGGKLNLTGKGGEGWTIQGSLKQVPADIFNKLAGDKLPFDFHEVSLNAEIEASTANGKVTGEITPDIKRLTLIVEKPGFPTQTIARILNEELTFSLPFTLKGELTLQYADTFKKLKEYRKYPLAPGAPETAAVAAPGSAKAKNSFWPF